MQKDFKKLIVNISTILEKDLNEVNKLIIAKMQNDVELIPTIAHHIISSGGKRIRPILTLLASKTLNYQSGKDILIAACIEFIHTATLLHDDVVDENNARRGISTSNNIWGNKASILVGDFLFSKAFELMVATDSLEILEVLSHSSSTIAQGEVLQLSHINNIDLSMDIYLEIIKAKTASLFSAATRVAGILAESDQDTLRNITEYGENLGILFQIVDDILDYQGDESNLGKNIGTDLKEGKITIPIIFTLSNCNQEERSNLKRIFEDLDQKETDFDLVLSHLNKYQAIDKSKEFARVYLNKGLANLESLKNNNEFKESLKNLIILSLERLN